MKVILARQGSFKDFSDVTDIIMQAFGFDNQSFSQRNPVDDGKLTMSFKNNLALLIQKTWVEKTDIELKERILYAVGVAHCRVIHIAAGAAHILFHTSIPRRSSNFVVFYVSKVFARAGTAAKSASSGFQTAGSAKRPDRWDSR